MFAAQALAITPGGAERVDLLERAARAAGDALRPDERIGYLEEAVAILRSKDDRNAEVMMMSVLVDALSDLNRADALRAVVEEMRERVGDEGDERVRAELDHAMGYVQYFANRWEESLASLDRALATFDRIDATDRFHRTLGEKAFMLGNLGRHREAMLLRRGQLAIATEENDLRAKASALIAMGVMAEEPRDGLAWNLEAAEVGRRGGYGGPEMTRSPMPWSSRWNRAHGTRQTSSSSICAPARPFLRGRGHGAARCGAARRLPR